MSQRTLLVTNDFPPKIGGIQNYLWELWRRLPVESTAVYTTPHSGTAVFDAATELRIERSPEPVLIPYPWLVSRINDKAEKLDADLILLDPAVPLGAIGPFLERPYGVILHGAEVTIPSRLPGTRQILRRVLNGASLVVSAGQYALDEAEACAGRSLPSVVVPPGVDTDRFVPLTGPERAEVRGRLGVGADAPLVASVSRLVPRKGMSTLVEASVLLRENFGDLRVVIGGTGREEKNLRRQIEQTGAPVTMLGRIDDALVPELYAAADLMAMVCNVRWFGLEQEGFGIVFVEAAAAGVPQVAGRSGGAAEAVATGLDGNPATGIVLDDPDDAEQVASAIGALLADPDRRSAMGEASRARAVAEFSYDVLAARLHSALQSWSRL